MKLEEATTLFKQLSPTSSLNGLEAVFHRKFFEYQGFKLGELKLVESDRLDQQNSDSKHTIESDTTEGQTGEQTDVGATERKGESVRETYTEAASVVLFDSHGRAERGSFFFFVLVPHFISACNLP